MNFTRLANAHRVREPLREAVRLVLVEGISAAMAARVTGIFKSQLSKRLAGIRASVDAKGRLICPCCERTIEGTDR